MYAHVLFKNLKILQDVLSENAELQQTTRILQQQVD